MAQMPNTGSRFNEIELLESGEHTDSNSHETIRYDVERLEFADTVPVTLTSEDNDISRVGKVVPGSDKIVDSTLYVDVVIDTSTSAGEYANQVLSDEKSEMVGEVGPVIQPEGQEITIPDGGAAVMDAGIISRVVIE